MITSCVCACVCANVLYDHSLVTTLCEGGSRSNNSRTGTVFVTQREVYFTSSHLLLGDVQKVVTCHCTD
jgi:hypothetical protein